MHKKLLTVMAVVTLLCLALIGYVPRKKVKEAEITQQTITTNHRDELPSEQFEPEWELPENLQTSNEEIIETKYVDNSLEMKNEITDPHVEQRSATEELEMNPAATQPSATESPEIIHPITQPGFDWNDNITAGGDVGAGGEIAWD